MGLHGVAPFLLCWKKHLPQGKEEEVTMWLDDDDTADTTNLKEVVEKWRKLRFERDRAEKVFEETKKHYDEFCEEVLSKKFRQNGVECFRLEDGTELKVVGKIRCSLSKDDTKRAEVAEFLTSHSADYLVSPTLTLSSEHESLLTSHSVPYRKTFDMNTTSVKAWVKGEMEAGNLRREDLPGGLSWYMYDELQVKESL